MLKIMLRSRKIAPSANVEKEELLAGGTRISSGARLVGDIRTDEDVVIDCNAVIYGPVSLGRGTYIGPNCVVGFPDSEEIVKLINSDTIADKKPTVLGEKCIVRSGTTLYSSVKVADKVACGHNVMVREGVTIGELTRVGTNVVVDGKTSIGARVSIQTGVYICTYSKIEDGVFLGPCCVLTNDKYVEQKAFKLVGPTVKKGASVGANALLFAGVTVGEGAVVGAQALVNSDMPPRTIFVGIPARRLRSVPKDWHSRLLGI
jgi:acetyltransferase-like isoleucine patch superfamily enzyme